MDDDELKKHFPAPFARLIEKAGREQGIRLEDLPSGAEIAVETRNSVYTLKVVDPARRRVVLSGGRLTESKTLCFQGSLVHPQGSMLMPGWIKMGCSLEFGGLLDRLVTTAVRRVTVNGVPVLPRENSFRQ